MPHEDAPVVKQFNRSMVPGAGLVIAVLASGLLWVIIAGIAALA